MKYYKIVNIIKRFFKKDLWKVHQVFIFQIKIFNIRPKKFRNFNETK